MNIKAFINEMPVGGKIAFMGVGSVLKGDDGAGMYFAKRLSKLVNRRDVLILKGSTAPENLTGVIKSFKPDVFYIIDAAFMGLSAGEVQVIKNEDINSASFSTHMLPLFMTLDYIEAEIGCDTVCLGIQAQSTQLGEPVSEKVKQAAQSLAQAFGELLTEKQAK